MVMRISSLDLRNGIISSLAGTVVLSAIMVVKQMAGMVPQMNPIADRVEIAHGLLGAPDVPLVGWVLHFALGTFVWGTLFGVLRPMIPGSSLIKGLLFGTGAWLLMMGLFMPMAGQGLFGMSVGMIVPVMALMLDLIYGAVPGIAYGKLSARRP